MPFFKPACFNASFRFLTTLFPSAGNSALLRIGGVAIVRVGRNLPIPLNGMTDCPFTVEGTIRPAAFFMKLGFNCFDIVRSKNGSSVTEYDGHVLRPAHRSSSSQGRSHRFRSVELHGTHQRPAGHIPLHAVTARILDGST